jgi:uncharacterized protein YdhG (YjbR/CyaY superfamily)
MDAAQRPKRQEAVQFSQSRWKEGAHMTDRFASIDDYIRSFPKDVQKILEDVRQTIRTVVPEGEETISYNIPTIKVAGKYVVYFAGHKQHIGLYPVPAGDETFEQELALYREGKGTLRFPLDQPIPHALIERVVALLVKERESR